MPKKPTGYDRGGNKKIAVTFDPKLFKRLVDRAEERGEKFSAVINDVTACGLLCLEEAGE